MPSDLGGEAKAGLNIHSDRPHDSDPATIATVRHEVTLASRGLPLAVRLARHREAGADLQAAMASRNTTDLAAGIIMGQNRCPQHEAFENLRAVSRPATAHCAR